MPTCLLAYQYLNNLEYLLYLKQSNTIETLALGIIFVFYNFIITCPELENVTRSMNKRLHSNTKVTFFFFFK